MIDFPREAFAPFEEPLVWRQAKSPYSSETVRGVVFHERKEIEAYQSMQGVIKRYSDTWTVRASERYARVLDFARGDRLVRQTVNNEELIVQSITKEDGEWIIAVSSNDKL